MDNPSVAHDTFVIERIYEASPERVFAAWADPAQKRQWFAEGEDWAVDSFEADFRECGLERSRFRFAGGQELANDTFYHHIVPDRRIVSSYTMTVAGSCISASLTTMELEPVGPKTRLRFTEQVAFFEGADGTERRREGWGVLLDRLTAALSNA
jgi:uncharacterized protein YndB with AHSA1/START domain